MCGKSSFRLGQLLIFVSLLQCFLLLCQASELIQSLSLGNLIGLNGSNREKVQDPIKFADDSLLSGEGKSNKVSKLLRFIHEKAENRLYRRQDADKGLKPVHGKIAAANYKGMTDDEVVASACAQDSGKPCQLAVKIALRGKPEEKTIIARSIRHRPEYVDPSKLLYHKLFESAISKAEQHDYDEKIDKVFDMVVKRNPYGWAATTAVNMATKKAL